MNRQKGFANILFVTIIVIAAGLAGFFYFTRTKSFCCSSNTSPTNGEAELTNEIALSLLKDDLFNGECRPERVAGKYGSCTINISKGTDKWTVTVTYDGLYDDSVKASRIQTNVIYQNRQWVKGRASRSQQCWPSRGHQDFSTELCI